MKFRFEGSPRGMAHSAKDSCLCFDEINVCAHVSFRMISSRITFTCYVIARNEILFLPK